MGRLLMWMNKPDPGIPDTSWAGFMDAMAALAVFVVITTVVLTILMYTGSAKRRKVYFPGDLFSSYTPMRWIFLAVPGALVAGGLCFWQYEEGLSSTGGRFGIALQLAFFAGILSALISYLLIVLVPQFTPKKFRYRPAPYLHRRRAA